MKDIADWMTEEQLIAEISRGKFAEIRIGKFSLDRLRRAGLIPWDRRFFGVGGSVTVYPPIAVSMIERIRELKQQGIKGFDRLRLALWRDGYPIVDAVVRWHDTYLHRLEKRAKLLVNANVEPAVVELAGKGHVRRRRKALQPVFNKVRQPQARRAVLEWSFAIGAGLVPPASIYTPGSAAAKRFRKITGASELPDPLLELEQMSFARLREINTDASAGDRELARLDCNRLDGLVTLATSLDWRRVRKAIGVTHRGGPETPIAPFERLIGLWNNLDCCAVLLPFLIFVRSRPSYRYELDERFASLEIELQALAERAGNSAVMPDQQAA